MFFGENKPDKFGMRNEEHLQEFVALTLVVLMLFAFFMKVMFL